MSLVEDILKLNAEKEAAVRRANAAEEALRRERSKYDFLIPGALRRDIRCEYGRDIASHSSVVELHLRSTTYRCTVPDDLLVHALDYPRMMEMRARDVAHSFAEDMTKQMLAAMAATPLTSLQRAGGYL